MDSWCGQYEIFQYPTLTTYIFIWRPKATYMYPRKKSWLHITIQNFTMHHFTWFLSYDMKKVGLCVLATYAMPWFFKASKLKARLLVITLVSDLWSDLVFFLFVALFCICQVVTFTKRIKMAVWFLIFYNQIYPKWIRLDQTWSNWISQN